MVITMAKLRMAHASTHGARKPPGPIVFNQAWSHLHLVGLVAKLFSLVSLRLEMSYKSWKYMKTFNLLR